MSSLKSAVDDAENKFVRGAEQMARQHLYSLLSQVARVAESGAMAPGAAERFITRGEIQLHIGTSEGPYRITIEKG